MEASPVSTNLLANPSNMILSIQAAGLLRVFAAPVPTV
jgi:hypothetical protein